MKKIKIVVTLLSLAALLMTCFAFASCEQRDNGNKEHYVVTFNLNYDGAKETIIVDTDSKTGLVAKPTNPERDEYKFMGWYYTPECTGNPFVFSTKISRDITLYACWEYLGSPAEEGTKLINEGEILLQLEEFTTPNMGGKATLKIYSNGTFTTGSKKGEWYYNAQQKKLLIGATGNAPLENYANMDGSFIIEIRYYSFNHGWETTVSEFEAAVGTNFGKPRASWVGSYS